MSKNTLSNEEVTSIAEFGNVLRDIHTRLVREGYFVDGRRIWNVFKCASPIAEVAIGDDN